MLQWMLNLLGPMIVMFLTVYGLTHVTASAPDNNNNHFKTIDGLRGYLAFFVFLYHSNAWYFYIKTGTWGDFGPHLYTHLGQGSVVIFFYDYCIFIYE